MASPSLSDRPTTPAAPPSSPPLHPGDHLDQETFHALYEAMPEGFKAELIGGVVIVPTPVSAEHGGEHNLVSGWLFVYQAATPGTAAFADTTVLLGVESEPQPDNALIILPEHGGRSRFERGYLAGAPELVVEVAYSSHAHDLHRKYRDYEAAGVAEYVVIVLHQRRVEWFRLQDGRFTPHPPGEDGLFRSAGFPGLWLDPAALLERDGTALLQVLQRGLATPEHAAFVESMKDRRKT